MSFQLPPPGQEKMVTSLEDLLPPPTADAEEVPLSPVAEEDENPKPVEVKDVEVEIVEKPKPDPNALSDKV